MRQGTLGRAVTLVAVTGWGQESDKAQALAAGFNHHFTKPVAPERLFELLRTDLRADAARLPQRLPPSRTLAADKLASRIVRCVAECFAGMAMIFLTDG